VETTRRRFYVVDAPKAWSLEASDGELRLRVHWAHIVGTFGFALLRRRELVFSNADVEICGAKTLFRERVLQVRRKTDGRKLAGITPPLDRDRPELIHALRDAGFVVHDSD
jgi:hypothetical protein